MTTPTNPSHDADEPRRNDLLNLNSRLWMIVGWVLLALAVFLPVPWW